MKPIPDEQVTESVFLIDRECCKTEVIMARGDIVNTLGNGCSRGS